MSELLPPSAFEFPSVTEEDSRRIFQNAFEEFDRRVLEDLQRKLGVRTDSLEASPQQEPRVYESAIKNQATLIEQLNARVANYEFQIAALQRQLGQGQNDLEMMAQQCETSLATLDEEHTKSMKKVEVELENCRKKLEKEASMRQENEERFQALEEKNKSKLDNLQASLDEKISELKEAREESGKLRLYFTGGRDLISIPSFSTSIDQNQQSASNFSQESEAVTNLRVQIEALQHIINVQEEQLRTSKPDIIPGLATLEKWRRKVYEMMVRTKLNEIAVGNEIFQMRQEVSSTKEQLKICEAKLTAKEFELKEVKSRFDSQQKIVGNASSNEAKLRECLQIAAQGIAQFGIAFKETVSRAVIQIANMERRLELATMRVRQIGAGQRNAARIEAMLTERNSEKLACDMQVVMANETIEDLRRQLSYCQQQIVSAAKQKATALGVLEGDRVAERDATSSHIRSLTCELQDLRIEHAKLISHNNSLKRRLDETEEQARQMGESLSSRLEEAQRDYEALAKVAREHGVMEKIGARRMSTPTSIASSGHMFMRGPGRNSTGSSRLTPSSGQQEFEFYAFKKNPEPAAVINNKNNESRSSLSSQQSANNSTNQQQQFFEEESIFDLDQMIQLFAMCDQDNDDYVTRADFVRVSHEIGGLPPSLVCQLDRVLPPNGGPNFRVSLHELVTMVRNFNQQGPNNNNNNSPMMMMPLQQNSSNSCNNGSSPVKLKRYDNNPPNTPDNNSRPQFSADSSKWQQTHSSPCSPTPLPQNKAEITMPAEMTSSMVSSQSVIARLQREKESLEIKLAALLQHRQKFSSAESEQISNLQALIAKYHQQIYVALELQKQQRTPPPPKPPPRRSLPVQQNCFQQNQQQQQQSSMPRVVNVQHCTPPCNNNNNNGTGVNFGLEQIDEMSQPESGDDNNCNGNNNNNQQNNVSCSSESSSSSSDGEQVDNDDRRNRRRLRHSRHHNHNRQSSRQQPQVVIVQPEPQPQPQPGPPVGFIDIETVDSAFQQQEQLVGHLKQQLIACMNDRDRYKKLAQDFYRRVQYQKNSEIPCSPTTPMMENCSSKIDHQLPSTPTSSRMAEVRQLPRISSVSPMLNNNTDLLISETPNITAAELNHGALSTPVAEHLVEETEHAAVIQELVQSLAASGCRIPPEKLQEFAAELECRSSKADRLRAAADLLASSLAKQRQHASNLATALARSEENQTALRMALDSAMQKADAFQALLKLSESEQLLLLAHCRAVGVVNYCQNDDQAGQFETDQQTVLLGQAVSARRQAELEAQRLLSRLDNSCGILGHNSGASSAVGGELLLSSNNSSNSNSSPRATGTCSSTGTASSRTTEPEEGGSSSGVGSTTSTWTSLDEQRLREYAAQLDRDVQAMQMTLNDPVLESAAVTAAQNGQNSTQINLINASLLDSPLPLSSLGTNGSGSTNKDSLFNNHQTQIETAVLIQELATLKEQRAESRTQCFILDREKRALETELKARDQQATILRVQLDQARLELEEATGRVKKFEEILHSGNVLNSETTSSNNNLQSELFEALQREKRLRSRIQELVDTLEMVGRSAEKQFCDGGIDLVSELRKANVTLSESYERARKKQEQRIKRLETQLGAVTSRYETKVSLLKKQVALLEETTNIGGGHVIDGPTFAPEAHL